MVALSYTRPRTPMAAAPRPSTMLARPMSWVTTISFGKRRSTMAKSALSAPIETSSTSTQKPSWLASRPRAFSGERGSPWRMCRSRFWVVLPTMTTGVQASRAQARATLVTGQASASINRTRPREGAASSSSHMSYSSSGSESSGVFLLGLTGFFSSLRRRGLSKATIWDTFSLFMFSPFVSCTLIVRCREDASAAVQWREAANERRLS